MNVKNPQAQVANKKVADLRADLLDAAIAAQLALEEAEAAQAAERAILPVNYDKREELGDDVIAWQHKVALVNRARNALA